MTALGEHWERHFFLLWEGRDIQKWHRSEKPKLSCTGILKPKFPGGQVKFSVIFPKICSSRIQCLLLSQPWHSQPIPVEQLDIRQGHNHPPNSIPGRAIDSQRDFGHSFQLFPHRYHGDRAGHPPESSSGCRGWGKKTKQQQSAPEKLPAEIIKQNVVLSLTQKLCFHVISLIFFLSFLLVKRKGKKCEANPDNFVVLGFTSREISPFPSPSLH